jgi:hypothetical protein
MLVNQPRTTSFESSSLRVQRRLVSSRSCRGVRRIGCRLLCLAIRLSWTVPALLPWDVARLKPFQTFRSPLDEWTPSIGCAQFQRGWCIEYLCSSWLNLKPESGAWQCLRRPNP